MAKSSISSPRLHVRGAILGFRRSKGRQYPSVSLVKIEGVATKDEAKFYLGKKVALITKGTSDKKHKYRVNWGKIRAAHGSNGTVRVAFRKNVDPKRFGSTCRVMLFPSRI
eukprot:CAMPEP_0170739360 /NCGR_PEP_ID=MMETSP0437-20130122/5123_1 /TAXON_ID=0 /ORGANISM="Sexangularia sp." /LENGTH=110 /DNA_ID=CAMNT_0011077817 /DNA_START=63 /DNA_END=395 /DNA_ORIENTATION=+